MFVKVGERLNHKRGLGADQPRFFAVMRQEKLLEYLFGERGIGEIQLAKTHEVTQIGV